jgi:hypothetical protein
MGMNTEKKVKDNSRITATEMKFMKIAIKHTWLNYK